MKNAFLLFLFIAAMTGCTTLFAQSYWSMSGNSATTSNFIGTTNNVALKIKTNNSTRMIFDDYKTGIGTETPGANLHIHSQYLEQIGPGIEPFTEGGRPLIMAYENWFKMTTPTTGTGDSDGFSIKQESLGVTIRQFENDNLNIFGYTGKGLTVLPEGTVLFGNGGAHATVNIGSFASGTSSSYTAYLGINARRNGSQWTFKNNGSFNGGAVIWGSTNGAIYFATVPSSGASDQVLTTDELKSNVNLMLSSSGILKAKEVQVTLTGWPDYVCDEGYKLMSLGETEQYIKENGHLPGVPSAQKVEEEGLSLGEMNARLMQKVEELTLHVIELQKQIDELKKER